MSHETADDLLYRLIHHASHLTLRYLAERLASLYRRPKHPRFVLSVEPIYDQLLAPSERSRNHLKRVTYMAGFTLYVAVDPPAAQPPIASCDGTLTINGVDSPVSVAFDGSAVQIGGPFQTTDAGSLSLKFSSVHGSVGPTTSQTFDIASLAANLSPGAPGFTLSVAPA